MAKRPSSKHAAAKRPVARASAPAPDEPADQGSWIYTIGISLAVVTFVIGVYQTMVEEDLAGNYWLFMIASGMLLLIRWDRLRREKKQPPK